MPSEKVKNYCNGEVQKKRKSTLNLLKDHPSFRSEITNQLLF